MCQKNKTNIVLFLLTMLRTPSVKRISKGNPYCPRSWSFWNLSNAAYYTCTTWTFSFHKFKLQRTQWKFKIHILKFFLAFKSTLELTKGLLSDFRTSYLTNFGKKLIKRASERINLMLHNEGLLEHFFKLLIFSKVFWRCFTLINWNWVKKWKIPWSMANHIYHMMNYSFYWTHSKLQRFSFLTPIFLKVCVL